MKGYINNKGQFTQVLHGDKAFEMVDDQIIEYEVKEFTDLARINFLSLGKDRVQKLEQQNRKLQKNYEDKIQELRRAANTLKLAGYTDSGGSLWSPPQSQKTLEQQNKELVEFLEDLFLCDSRKRASVILKKLKEIKGE
jgi:hypothetical protein